MFSIRRAASVSMLLALVVSVATSSAETVRLYFDATSPQIAFAAGDIRTALEKQQRTVQAHGLAALAANDPGKKIVLALAADQSVAAALAAQGGNPVAALGEQAFALRTTQKSAPTYWALDGDAVGAMYGGLQLAENIAFDRFAVTYDSDESPQILKRGIKLNLPLDKNRQTYETANKVSDSARQSIPHVWDLGFWTEWFDEMARHRYNVVSVWNNHPFTSMVKLPDYPDVAIQNVTGYDGFSKPMTIDDKIASWRKVMAYAKTRGFDCYLVNWNVWTDGAADKYGITDDKATATTNPATIAYPRVQMHDKSVLKEFTDLGGRGIPSSQSL